MRTFTGLLFVTLSTLVALPNSTSPEQLLQTANTLYDKQLYDSALTYYNQLIDKGIPDAALYYNAGNSYFKRNQIGRAIVCYERALLLNPSDEDIRFNLELARSRITDKIDAIPGMFLLLWIQNTADIATTDQWATLSVICFIIGLVLMFLYFFARTIVFKKVGFYLGLTSLLVSAGTWYFAGNTYNNLYHNKFAIVTIPSLTAKSSPAVNGNNLFVVHEGLKVEITDKVGDWYEIKLPNGHKGWVENQSIEGI